MICWRSPPINYILHVTAGFFSLGHQLYLISSFKALVYLTYLGILLKFSWIFTKGKLPNLQITWYVIELMCVNIKTMVHHAFIFKFWSKVLLDQYNNQLRGSGGCIGGDVFDSLTWNISSNFTWQSLTAKAFSEYSLGSVREYTLPFRFINTQSFCYSVTTLIVKED